MEIYIYNLSSGEVITVEVNGIDTTDVLKKKSAEFWGGDVTGIKLFVGGEAVNDGVAITEAGLCHGCSVDVRMGVGDRAVQKATKSPFMSLLSFFAPSCVSVPIQPPSFTVSNLLALSAVVYSTSLKKARANLESSLAIKLAMQYNKNLVGSGGRLPPSQRAAAEATSLNSYLSRRH